MNIGVSLLRRLTGSIAGLTFMIGTAHAAGLTLNITDTGFDPIPAGGTIEYSVRVQNGGNTRSAADTLDFTIPDGATYTGVSGGLAGCTPSPDVTGPTTISCPIPDLAPRAWLEGAVHIVPDLAGVITMAGALSGEGISGDESTTVTEGADLNLGFSAPSDIRAGEVLEFSAIITNNGPYAAAGTDLTIPLPSALSENVVLPPGCEVSGNEVTCSITDPIAVGDSVTLDFSTQVMTDSQSHVSVAGSIKGTTPEDPNGKNDAASFDVSISPGTDLQLQKSRTPSGLLYVGQDVIFTLNPEFVGTAPLEAAITDALPANYELVSVTPSGAGWTCNAANPVACTYSSATPDEAGFRAPIQIVATPVSQTPAGAPVTNTAEIDGPEDVRPENNSASDGSADIAVPATDLVAHKSGPTHGLVTVGNSYDWRIWTANQGNIGFAGTLELTDHLPAGLELTGIAAPAGWSCSPTAVTGPTDIICTSDNYTAAAPLAVGARTPEITLTTKVLEEGPISNGLTVGYSNENHADRDHGNNTTYSGVTAGDGDEVQIADLRLTKSVADAGPHLAGDPVSFTVTVTNDGPGIAEDVRILDRLNDLYSVDDTTTAVTLDVVPGDAVCSVVRGAGFYSDLSCTIQTLAMDESRAITFTALAGGNAGAKTNTAETYSTQTPDPNYANNSASAGYDVDARTDVTVEKTASHGHMAEVQAGQKLIYELSAKVPGNGLSAAENVTVTDALPAGLRIVSATPSQGSCAAVTNLADGITTAGSELICNLGTITNGNEQTVEVTTIPSTAIAGTTITNPVSIATSTTEIDSTNNTDAISHQITRPTLDLVTNKTDGPDPVELGENTTYTITVHNAGPSEAFNLEITDLMPADGLSFQSIDTTSAGLNCTTTAAMDSFGGTIICTQPNLPVDATAQFTVAMKAEKRGQWVNRVEARSDEYADETQTTNNDVNETTTVFERSNLKVTKAASQSPVDLHEPFDWEITVENVTATGIGLAENVVLRDMLPANMAITGAPSTAGVGASCDAPVGGRDLTCIIDDMTAGEQITVTLPVRVTSVASSPETVPNTATVSTDSFDDNPDDNTDTANVEVLSTAITGNIWRDFDENDLRDANDSGIGGITVALTGTDEWGAPVTLDTTTAADGSYDFGLLPPGNYRVSYTPPTGDTYLTGAALPGGAGDADGATGIQNITVTTGAPSGDNDFTLIPQARLALAKQVSAPVFQADGSHELTYTFNIHNESQEPVEDVTLADDLLAGFGALVAGTPDHGQFQVVNVTGGTLETGADDRLGLSTATLNPGEARTLTMVLRVNPALPRPAATLTHTNRATVDAVGAWSGQGPSDGSNDGATPQHGVTSDTSRPVAFAPAITLSKSAILDNGGATARPGDVVRYSFEVTNTGNTPLVDVTLEDLLPGLDWDSSGPIARLDPGATDTTSFAAHYTLTQADIEGGGVDNTATVTGRWAEDGVADPTVSASDDAAITALAEPGLTVTKVEVSNTVQDPTLPGDSIRYGFTVTNTGNVALRDLELTDALPVVANPVGSFAIGTLAPAGEPGDSVTFAADYIVTQDDIDAGKVLNTATVSGVQGSEDTPISADSNEVETPLHPDPQMRVTKLPDTPLPTDPRAGDPISWTITIENLGNTRLEIGTIAEPLPDTTVSSPAEPVLLPGESTTATATHTLTQAEIDAGAVVNQVTVSGKVPGSGIPFTDTPSGNDPDTPNEDETVTPLPAVPSIALQKVLTSDVSAPLMPGDVIEFDFTIRNTGNVTLGDLVLTDHLPDVVLADAGLAGLMLAPAAEVTVTGTYALEAADIEAGGLTNSATVTGDDPHGTPVSDESGTGFDNDDPTPVALIRNPQIALIKTIATAPADPVMAGDQITYAFEIRNTGNVELRDIDLTDLVGGVTLTGSRTAPLGVGAVDATSFTGSYALTQTDIDAGSFANSAEVTATGTGPDGTPEEVSDISGTDTGNDDPTEFPIGPRPALTLVKAADDSAIGEPAAVGEVITYAFTVTNTGNVTLTDVTVNDPLLGGDFAGNVIASLAPGAHQVLSADYAITQGDIETGVVINRASVSGDYRDPDSGEPATTPSVPSEEIVVPLDQAPHLAVVKLADDSAISDPAVPGEVITYSFTVANIGNVMVEDVVLTDPLPGLSTGSFTLGNMAAGDVQVVTATYAITQADIDAGRVVNQATASGEHGGDPVSDLSGPDMTSDEETVVPLAQAATLTLDKSADAGDLTDPAVPGQQIRYAFTVTNTGNVTLRDVVVEDPLPGLAPASFAIGDLAPGASASAGPAIYAITESDIIAGKVENRALARGEYGPPGDPEVVETPSTNDEGVDGPNIVPIVSEAGIALVKQLATGIDPDSLRLGDEIRWQFAVTNTGNVPLDEVTITETMVDATVSGGPVSLAVGATDATSFTASHVITQADLDAGEIINLARADGVFVDGDGGRHPVSDLSGTDIDNDDPTRTVLTQRAAIDLVKTVDISALSTPPVAGDLLHYVFTITNTGEVTLQDVTLTDPMPGLDLAGAPIASLAPGASDSTAYSASYALTQADIDSGAALENQATVSGDYADPDGNPQQVTDLSGTEAGTDGPTVVEFTRQPGLELVKSADPSAISEVAQEGEAILYTFTVTNTGNVTLSDVTIDDPLPGLVLSGAPIASLAPGEVSDAITGLYAITLEDIRAAGRDNTATAHGVWTPDGGAPVAVDSEESSARVELGYPEIALDITIGELRDLNGDGIMGVGDAVLFRFMVTNTGTVPLNGVDLDYASLSLPLSGLTCTPITLAVGESAFLECSGATHVITAADAARGDISLTGEAIGTSDAGVTVRAPSAAATVTDLAAGGVTLEKLAGVETAMIGDVVPYTIRITNAAEGVAVSATLVDTLPEGFAYRAGSARLDGVAVELEENGRRITLDPLALAPGETRVLMLDARVGGSVRPGVHVNRARLLSGTTGADIAPEATAAVRVMADAVLQCATVLGRVFDDVDQNGHMSRADAERGLPNVRLVAPNGLAITTDAHGRFNVPCAALPRAIGANFMLKLDERTLPAGYRMTTENPRVVRLTPGMITRLDFGATLARLVRIDLSANAFDGDAPGPALQAGLQKLVAEIRDTVAMVRLTYLLGPDESEPSARTRLRKVEQALREMWRRDGLYKLNIETLIQRAGATR